MESLTTIYSPLSSRSGGAMLNFLSFPFCLFDAPSMLPFVVLAFAEYLVFTNACALSAFAFTFGFCCPRVAYVLSLFYSLSS